MRKGIIATLIAAICVMIAATYAFAAPGTTEKAEATTKEKEVTTTEAKKEVKKEDPAPTTEEKKETTAKKEETTVADDQEETNDSESKEDAEEEETDDPDEIDEEEQEKCDHNWTDKSYAYDQERGYVIEETCSKCNLIRFTPVTEEEYEAATQEPDSNDCTYEDNDEAEVVE